MSAIWVHVGWRDNTGLAFLVTDGLHSDRQHEEQCRSDQCISVYEPASPLRINSSDRESQFVND